MIHTDGKPTISNARPKVLSASVQLNNIIRYENGELTYDEVIALFQSLVDSGLVWSLQGSYVREAQSLIASGEIHAAS